VLLNTSKSAALYRNATSANLTAIGSNSCGNGTISANYPIKINQKPITPIINLNFNTLHADAPLGNQWHDASGPISGAIYQN
jgi:hypothetical protein